MSNRNAGRFGLIELLPNEQARLTEIEGRTNAATPGPWEADEDGDVWSPSEGITDPHPSPTDALFIAHAREDVPWLVVKLRAALVCNGVVEKRHGDVRAHLNKWLLQAGPGHALEGEIKAALAALALGGCSDGCGAAEDAHCWNNSAVATCGGIGMFVGEAGQVACGGCRECCEGMAIDHALVTDPEFRRMVEENPDLLK